MNSKTLTRTAVASVMGTLLLVGFHTGSAADLASLEVLRYVNDPLAEFDARGDYVGDIPNSDLPDPSELKVIDSDDSLGLIEIEFDERKAWIDRADVELSQLKRPNSECTGLKIAKPTDSSAMSAMGVGGDC